MLKIVKTIALGGILAACGNEYAEPVANPPSMVYSPPSMVHSDPGMGEPTPSQFGEGMLVVPSCGVEITDNRFLLNSAWPPLQLPRPSSPSMVVIGRNDVALTASIAEQLSYRLIEPVLLELSVGETRELAGREVTLESIAMDNSSIVFSMDGEAKFLRVGRKESLPAQALYVGVETGNVDYLSAYARINFRTTSPPVVAYDDQLSSLSQGIVFGTLGKNALVEGVYGVSDREMDCILNGDGLLVTKLLSGGFPGILGTARNPDLLGVVGEVMVNKKYKPQLDGYSAVRVKGTRDSPVIIPLQ